MNQTPSQITVSAVAQLLSGILNVFLMSWLLATVLGTVFTTVGGAVTGVLTCGMCPFGAVGGICGFASCMLIPVGVMEIVAGIGGLANPRGSVQIMRYTAWLELVSLPFGGAISFFVGALAVVSLGAPSVALFLSQRDAT